MAQRPTNDFDIDPNITSGTDLANILNRFQDAIDSGNSGTSRPAYLAAGGMWVKEGNPMRLYLYDGTNDIELYNTTDGIVGGSQWKDNGNDIYYDAGSVGIGTDNPVGGSSTIGTIQLGFASQINGRTAGSGFYLSNNMYFDGDPSGTFANAKYVGATGANAIRLHAGVTSFHYAPENTGGAGAPITTITEAMRIDVSGRVGIGGQPSRSAEEIAKEAKDTLASWKSTFDERLKAEPKADKKAVTLEITNDEFSTFPTEKALVEKLTARNIGGGTAKLQVLGDGYFTGEIHAADFLRGGVPVVDAKDIVQTLSTLREATRDETTLEGLRDALSDAIGGLIQKFEAQISTTES